MTDAAFTFDYAGRTWQCREEAPRLLLRRLVKLATGPRRDGPRAQKAADRLARRILLASVTEPEVLAAALGTGDRLPEGVLPDSVMPQLLDHYATTTATDVETYSRRRQTEGKR